MSAPAVDSDGLDQARQQLAEASQVAAAAHSAVDEAASRVPAAQAELEAAETAYLEFDAQERQATAELLATSDRVAAHEKAVAQAEDDVQRLSGQMDGAARSSYINGGENSELAILLNAEDPADLVGSAEAQERASHRNVNLLAQLTDAKTALSEELAQLMQAQQQAQRQQQAANAAVAQAQLARDAARASRTALDVLVAERTAALVGARAAQADVQKLYDQLMAEKAAAEAAAAAAAAQAAAEKAAAERAAAERAAAQQAAAAPSANNLSTTTAAGSNGATRTGQAAVDFAMGFVGAGEEFRGLCLTFVDNAYAPTGGRLGTAVEQWERAVANGHGHPGDRNPPVGAQVFWQTSDPARHAAIYAGGGMVITTEAYNGRVGLVPMASVDTWGPYLGWATPYYG